tara:strand:+ start:126 stop:488 length:363 start_codon:yes stop_codon:yes gene_type:complete
MHLGTILYTWLKGELVGTDEFSNRYYRAKRDTRHGRQRRWVIFKGRDEPSKVPAEWHAWLHHITDSPLTESAAQAPDWQLPHQPNLSGTAQAYRPNGHELAGGRRAETTSDYRSWTPDEK